mmetsp:Transcript_13910/g.20628  ORF Transcript_13910/g.20628 Transcript_13910/m.20628 type:complete len:84 (+) Transcript_13910:150-401(+)
MKRQSHEWMDGWMDSQEEGIGRLLSVILSFCLEWNGFRWSRQAATRQNIEEIVHTATAVMYTYTYTRAIYGMQATIIITLSLL